MVNPRQFYRAVGWLVSELIPGQLVRVAQDRDWDKAVVAADALADREAETEVLDPFCVKCGHSASVHPPVGGICSPCDECECVDGLWKGPNVARWSAMESDGPSLSWPIKDVPTVPPTVGAGPAGVEHSPAPPAGPPNGHQIASSGGVTQLHRVIDLLNSGASPERVREWCEKQIEKRTAQK